MLQHIHINSETAFCSKCNTNILELSNFKYAGETYHYPKYSEELCECRKCGSKFLLRYDIFDDHGHINREVFTGDPNDPSYTFWQANLSEEQKKIMFEHFTECLVCQNRFNEEVLADGWFASLIHNPENKRNQESPR